MIHPVLKFMVFSLTPFLLILWSTSPDLWLQISSSAHFVGNNPASLLQLPSSFLVTGEALVKSLTCDNLDLHSSGPDLHVSLAEKKSGLFFPLMEGTVKNC
ncbi:hypothetical protein DSO57_1014998 [Entomophthora muscae]|uniref:Uncharacterized protein n=1 Tax=Entomophthora muscae TaxID=34485 RepID=A0ACC2UR37_9FUNG|nr:hypothetical protein DSO57_1014998 [Entomophthora muscae]